MSARLTQPWHTLFNGLLDAKRTAVSRLSASRRIWKRATKHGRQRNGNRPRLSETLWAEAAELRLTCEHAGIEDGMQILDLGCGWGSLSLWMAETYPQWTFIGPTVMSLFLMRISGVTLLEISLKQTRQECERYTRETNAFFPWFSSKPAEQDRTTVKTGLSSE